MSRDREVQQVTAELESLLDSLRVSVTALAGILIPPEVHGDQHATA